MSPLRLVDTPAYINYPGENGAVRYGEGIFIGYRYYDAKQAPVLFPFGYGLSYTTYAYSNPKVTAEHIKDVDGLTISVDVTNTGKVAGKEIVQVYVHDKKSELVRPPKELKGFSKVELQPGQTKTVSVALDFRSFAYYHPSYKQWITEDGEFELLIGSSSADIRCTTTITLQSTLVLPSLLGRDSTLREWIADPRGKQVIEPLLANIFAHMKQMFSSEEGDLIGMDPSEFLMEMPLAGLINIVGNGFADSPERAVDQLLAQVYRSN